MEDLDNSDRSPRRRSLDLSVAQVAASSMAAVAGAVLASELGVYGTILGAAVVPARARPSAALRCSSTPSGGPVNSCASWPLLPASADPAREPAGRQRPPDGAGMRLRSVRPLPRRRAHPDAGGGLLPQAESVAVYREAAAPARPRSWKSWALMSVLVFGLAMGTVTAVELVAGKPVTAIVRDEPGSGTSFGGHGRRPLRRRSGDPAVRRHRHPRRSPRRPHARIGVEREPERRAERPPQRSAERRAQRSAERQPQRHSERDPECDPERRADPGCRRVGGALSGQAPSTRRR